MKALLTAWHESASCLWCEKNRECVSVDFGDGFLTRATMCWQCVQKAVKVRAQQERSSNAPAETKQPNPSGRPSARRDAEQ